MSELYELTTSGAVPVTSTEMKSYMKVSSASDDALIKMMLSAATTYGEGYTGREFRANTWKLLTDEFASRICLRRAPVDTITTVQHLVSAALVTVADTVYYLKNSLQYSEILLNEDESWPTDTDEREQAIEIVFVTKAYRDIDAIKLAIMTHVAYWYANRGDCSDCKQAAKDSNANLLYDQFRIDRV